jgi:hypothetical protein
MVLLICDSCFLLRSSESELRCAVVITMYDECTAKAYSRQKILACYPQGTYAPIVEFCKADRHGWGNRSPIDPLGAVITRQFGNNDNFTSGISLGRNRHKE